MHTSASMCAFVNMLQWFSSLVNLLALYLSFDEHCLLWISLTLLLPQPPHHSETHGYNYTPTYTQVWM